jgi:hypothetical protein
MALSFGWKANDVRESIWKGDPALGPVPEDVIQAWREDGDASHFRPYVRNGKPTTITFRALNSDEMRMVMGLADQTAPPIEAMTRTWLLCFRLAVDFEGAPDQLATPSGEKYPRIERVRGLRMLSEGFTAFMEQSNPGITAFYGSMVYAATYPAETEKKASSQPSTPTPSLAAVSIKADGAPQPEAAQGAA